MTVKPVAAPAH